MIRFPCPLCGKMLKVAPEMAGKPIACTRCGEPSLVPALAAADGGEPVRRSRTREVDQPRGIFAGMSRRERWAVALVAGAGAAGLLLGVLAPLLPVRWSLARAVASWAVPLVACCAVLLLAMLYGHATGCPACGRWWSRGKIKGEFVAREALASDGGESGPSLYRTTYECGGCGHRWSVTDSDG